MSHTRINDLLSIEKIKAKLALNFVDNAQHKKILTTTQLALHIKLLEREELIRILDAGNGDICL